MATFPVTLSLPNGCTVVVTGLPVFTLADCGYGPVKVYQNFTITAFPPPPSSFFGTPSPDGTPFVYTWPPSSLSAECAQLIASYFNSNP
jgi:hypothetical protein